jgi:hypothetical protein
MMPRFVGFVIPCNLGRGAAINGATKTLKVILKLNRRQKGSASSHPGWRINTQRC